MERVDSEKIFMANAHPSLEVDSDRVRRLAAGVLQKENQDARVNIILATDFDLSDLNARYRGLNQPTDVLSFPMGDETAVDKEEQIMGEVYISLDRAHQQAREYGVDFPREVDRLVIHGLLHLCGYDHEDPEDARAMRAKEDQFLELYS
jgi:probable rRNA maturation factor